MPSVRPMVKSRLFVGTSVISVLEVSLAVPPVTVKAQTYPRSPDVEQCERRQQGRCNARSLDVHNRRPVVSPCAAAVGKLAVAVVPRR